MLCGTPINGDGSPVYGWEAACVPALERVMGLEPTTFCLGSRHSTS